MDCNLKGIKRRREMERTDNAFAQERCFYHFREGLTALKDMHTRN